MTVRDPRSWRILLTATVLAAGALATPIASHAARDPELAQLKRAAEKGDALAQFSYGQRVAASDPREQLKWYLRAAEQGYAPAQDATGILYERLALDEPAKKQSAAMREAVRWSSRAAYQGWPAAQVRLARYFATGSGVEKDPVIACMWAQMAVDNPSASFEERMLASSARDRIFEPISPDNVAEGQRLAGEFRYPEVSQLNPIETRLLVAALNLSAIYRRNRNASATVNRELFTTGETKEVDVDAHTVNLTCVAIDATTARFKVAGTQTEVTLELRK